MSNPPTTAEAPLPPPLLRALEAALPATRRSSRAEDLQVYARDMWPRGLLGVAAGVPAPHPPDVVVWPESAAEVQAVVRACRQEGVAIYPFGAGSGVCGGAVPRGGVVMDMKRMRGILSIDGARAQVTFQPGILGAHLERELERQGYTLGHFPSSIMCSTAGGWLATRGAGQCSSKYGKIEDMVQAVEVITGTGELWSLRQEEGGIDALQLIVGSEGTLGIITAATCAIRRAPAERRMRGWAFERIEAACQGMRAIMQAGLRPGVVRLYDELDTLISGGRGASASASATTSTSASTFSGEREGLTLDDWLEMLKPDAERAGKGITRWLVGRALGRPGMLNRLAERVVPRLAGGCQLIVGFEGEEGMAIAEERAAAEELVRAGGRDLGPGPGEHWLRHRYDVSFKMPRAFAAGAFVDTMEVATTWDRLLGLYHGVRRAVAPHAFVMAHFSHAYPEGCSIYFTFAGKRSTAAGGAERARLLAQDEARYDALWDAALDAVVRCGGTISHHHGVGRLKAGFMGAEHGDGMALYRGLKRALDPDGILNPGKMGLGGMA